MFFLLTYGTVNLACVYEGISKNPSFRPTFRFNHWSAALLGAFGCLGIMFLINAIWACVAIVLAAGLYMLIKRAKIIVQWGDLDSGLAYQRARKALLKLEQERYHPKNWRPSILALCGGAWSRVHLAEYACWLSANLGMVSLGQVIEGDLDNYFERRRMAEERLRKFIKAEEFQAFPVVVVEDDINAAVKALLQCHGVGGLRPNTLLLGWSEDPEKAPFFSEALLVARKMQRSIIIVSCEEERADDHVPVGPIDVWWNNPKEGSLMLMLAYLLKKNPEWRDRPLRLLRPIGLQDDVESATKKMNLILSVARIEAEIVILPTDNPLTAVRGVADGTGLLFAGFDPAAEEGPDGTLPVSLRETIDCPGDVIMVYSAGDVALQS
jgi:hypothetical protein